MLDEIKAIKSEIKDLRSFGYVMAGALAVICLIVWWKKEWIWPTANNWLLIVGGIFLAGGLLAPRALLPLQKVWMTFAVVMGFVMTRVILWLLFYLVFTPIHFLAALTGKRFLDDRLDPSAETYWHDRSDIEPDPKRCEHQF